MHSMFSMEDHVMLIINADDFGLTAGVCRAILDLFERNAISSTSLMTAAPGAIDRIRQWHAPRLSGRAGVHLQLTSGYALADKAKIPSLVEADGRFIDPRALMHPLAVDEVEIEWRAQISVASDLLGCRPSHLDSHHGMHRRPELTSLYVRLGAELGIPVRGGGILLKPNLDAFGAVTTDSILRDWTSKAEDENQLAERLTALLDADLTARSVEVVTHPGFVDDSLSAISSLVGPREIERQALLRFAPFASIGRRRLVRGSYSELAAFRLARGLV